MDLIIKVVELITSVVGLAAAAIKAITAKRSTHACEKRNRHR